MPTKIDHHVEQRLSRLEAKLAHSNRKTLLDICKEWAGVFSLGVALLYTFPLGVWDRFFVSAEQSRNKEVADLRDVAIKLTEIEDTLLRTSDSSAFGALFTKKGAIIASAMPLIKKRYGDLTANELLFLTPIIANTTGQESLVEGMYGTALVKAREEGDLLGVATAYRMKASHYIGIPGGSFPFKLDVSKARENYKAAIATLLSDSSERSFSGGTIIVADWALFEIKSGELACGQSLADWVIPAIHEALPNYEQHVRTSITDALKSRTASSNGDKCPDSILQWQVTGWPWQIKAAISQH